MIDTVKLGPVVYAVRQVENLHDFRPDGSRIDLNGRILHNECEMHLETKMHPQRARLVLWHEIVHGILSNAGVEDHDEKLVEALSIGLVEALRDNPALVALTVAE